MGARGTKYPPLTDGEVDALAQEVRDLRAELESARAAAEGEAQLWREARDEVDALRGRLAECEQLLAEANHLIADLMRSQTAARRVVESQASALEILRRERDELLRAVERPAGAHNPGQPGATPGPATNDGGADGA